MMRNYNMRWARAKSQPAEKLPKVIIIISILMTFWWEISEETILMISHASFGWWWSDDKLRCEVPMRRIELSWSDFQWSAATRSIPINSNPIMHVKLLLVSWQLTATIMTASTEDEKKPYRTRSHLAIVFTSIYCSIRQCDKSLCDDSNVLITPREESGRRANYSM